MATMRTTCHYPTDASDAQWEGLQPLLPAPQWRLGGPGAPAIGIFTCHRM